MGDAICEVQSDKVNIVNTVYLSSLSQSSATIYCPFDGVVTELMYQVDDIAKKDEPLIMIEVEDEGESPPLPGCLIALVFYYSNDGRAAIWS